GQQLDPHPCRLAVEAVGDLLQRLVGDGVGERFVQFGVQLAEQLGIPSRGGVDDALADLAQLVGDVTWNRVLEEVGDQLRQLDPQGVHVAHPLQVDRRHGGAPAFATDHQPVDPQHRQRLTNRGPADSELLGDRLLSARRPRGQGAETYALAQPSAPHEPRSGCLRTPRRSRALSAALPAAGRGDISGRAVPRRSPRRWSARACQTSWQAFLIGAGASPRTEYRIRRLLDPVCIQKEFFPDSQCIASGCRLRFFRSDREETPVDLNAKTATRTLALLAVLALALAACGGGGGGGDTSADGTTAETTGDGDGSPLAERFPDGVVRIGIANEVPYGYEGEDG